MVREKVYLETSVISYLTSRPSRDIVTLAKQQLTREWWETGRQRFELYVSDPVVDEIQSGDPGAARLRMESVAGLPKLAASAEAKALGRKLLSACIVPKKAELDALHIAIAAVHSLTYLLTWNCTHISNGVNKYKVVKVIAEAGYPVPFLMTPEDLLLRMR